MAIQPLVALLSSAQSVHASDHDTTVVINEIAPADTNDQWVELYNTSATVINLTGWQLRLGGDSVSAPIADGVQVAGHSWYIIALSTAIPSGSTGDPLKLLTGPDASDVVANEVDNWTVGSDQSYSRTQDGGSHWIAATPTKGVSNNDTVESQVTIEHFMTVNGDYKGVEVGFTGNHFGTVSAVEVDMTRADGSHVIKRANQGVLDAISNTANVSLTAPFVIQEGNFTEAGDAASWQPVDPTTWTSDTVPVSVTVTITDENGVKQASSDSFEQPTPYVDLLPVVSPPADTDPPLLVVTGETGAVVGKEVTLTVTASETLSSLHVFVGSEELSEGVTRLSDTVWSIVYTPAAAGTYVFRVNGVDMSGNLSEDAYFDVTAKVMIVAIPPTVEQTTAATKQLQEAVAALSQPLNTVNDIRPVMPHGSSVVLPRNGVLQAADVARSDSKAAIVSTDSGWKIFGMLWYWWGLIVITLVAAGWQFNRRLQRVAE
jgi:hypothetical protein